MIDYEKIISLWQNDVTRYCLCRGIPNMDLVNLRMGDLYNYDLYNAYQLVICAVAAYRKTPASQLRAKDMIAAIKKWYVLASNNKIQKFSMQLMTNNMFAHWVQRTK